MREVAENTSGNQWKEGKKVSNVFDHNEPKLGKFDSFSDVQIAEIMGGID